MWLSGDFSHNYFYSAKYRSSVIHPQSSLTDTLCFAYEILNLSSPKLLRRFTIGRILLHLENDKWLCLHCHNSPAYIKSEKYFSPNNSRQQIVKCRCHKDILLKYILILITSLLQFLPSILTIPYMKPSFSDLHVQYMFHVKGRITHINNTKIPVNMNLTIG